MDSNVTDRHSSVVLICCIATLTLCVRLCDDTNDQSSFQGLKQVAKRPHCLQQTLGYLATLPCFAVSICTRMVPGGKVQLSAYTSITAWVKWAVLPDQARPQRQASPGVRSIASLPARRRRCSLAPQVLMHSSRQRVQGYEVGPERCM